MDERKEYLDKYHKWLIDELWNDMPESLRSQLNANEEVDTEACFFPENILVTTFELKGTDFTDFHSVLLGELKLLPGIGPEFASGAAQILMSYIHEGKLPSKMLDTQGPFKCRRLGKKGVTVYTKLTKTVREWWLCQ